MDRAIDEMLFPRLRVGAEYSLVLAAAVFFLAMILPLRIRPRNPIRVGATCIRIFGQFGCIECGLLESLHVANSNGRKFDLTN